MPLRLLPMRCSRERELELVLSRHVVFAMFWNCDVPRAAISMTSSRTLRQCWCRAGIVTSSGKLWFLWQLGSQRDEENQLQWLSLPTSDHSAGDLALPPVHPELARRRRFVGRTRHYGLLRVHSALDQPFRAVDRCGLS